MAPTQFFNRQKSPKLRKHIIIATEGNKTEPAYFQYLNKILGTERFVVVQREHRPAPPSVLEDLVKFIQQNKHNLEESDEYWVVSDVNTWTIDHKKVVVAWCDQCSDNNFMAVSNPCFEIWLILHFEKEPPTFETSRRCKRYYLDHYGNNKEINDFNHIKIHHVKDAITRAEYKDDSGDSWWPETSGVSTVYKLVKKYFEG